MAHNSPVNSPRLTSFWWKIIYGFLAVLILCLFSWCFLDIPMAEFFHKVRIFRKPSKYITTLGNSGIWVTLAVCGMIYGVSRKGAYHYFYKFLALVMALATSGLIVNLLKISIGRYRPRAWVHQGIYKIEPFMVSYSKCSFPSGHSQTIFAAMVSLALIYPHYRWVFLCLALIVSATRIALTNHFLSDVIMGAFIGSMMAFIFYNYREKIGKKF